MKDFYQLLAKHFSQNTSESEEVQITRFIKDNSIEYKALKRLWESEGKSIDLVDFDKERALKKIKQQVGTKKKVVLISLFSSFRRIAAAIIFLISTAAISYLIFNNNVAPEMAVIQSTEQTQITLADGSLVSLNKNAKLTYPKSFSKNKREVTLEGEAFFEVTKDVSKPFSIKLTTTEVTVLGTSFNIKEDSLQTAVTVTTGKVNVKANQSNESVDLIPNYTAIVKSDELEHFETKNQNYLAWKTGVFVFEDAKLQTVIEALNTFYSTKFKIESGADIICSLTTKFDRKPVEEIIEILKLTCDVEIIKENNIYKLK